MHRFVLEPLMLWHVLKLDAETPHTAPRYVRVAVTAGDEPGELQVAWPGAAGVLSLDAASLAPEAGAAPGARPARGPKGGALRAPRAGRVQTVHVAVGDKVEAGAALVVLEAMKMEHVMTAPHPGVVAAVHVQQGEQVKHRMTLVELGAPHAD